MALRLSLVISGAADGAKKALDNVRAGIEALGAEAGSAATQVDNAARREEAAFDNIGRAAHRAAKAQTDQVRQMRFAAINATAQLQDIAVGIAAGQSPVTLALQQGTQLSAALGEGKGGLKGALETLKGAFTGLVNPTSLVTIGVIGLAAAFAQLVGAVGDGTPKIEADLEAQIALIKQIKTAYAEAAGAASSYGNNSITLNAFETQQQIGRLQSDLEAQAAHFRAEAAGRTGIFGPGVRVSLTEFGRATPFTGLLEGFRKDLADGTADFIKFRNDIAALAAQLPVGAPERSFAEQIIGDTAQAAKVQEELQRAIDLYKGLTGDSQAAATALGGTAEKFDLAGKAAAGALPALREYDALLGSIAGKTGAAPTQANTGSGGGGGFAAGGFTGDLPPDMPAGIVHGGEFVVNARATARNRGLLEAINAGVRGYASGGLVGGAAPAPAAGGFSVFGELAQDFSVLRGSVADLAQELARVHDPLQALGSVVRSVEQRFLDFAFNALDRVLFGGGSSGGGLVGRLIDGLFGATPAVIAGTGHTGAIIGAASSRRTVPLSLFAGAPRHHAGTPSLRPGEVPFIGMEGEQIGWPADLARQYGGGRQVNVFNISTPDVESFRRSKAVTVRGASRILRQARRYT